MGEDEEEWAGSGLASCEEMLQLEVGPGQPVLGERGLGTLGQPVPSWGATDGDTERGGGCWDWDCSY